MAAKQSGGVGAFGWTLLGFLAGVAATLAVQLIMVGRDRDDDADESAHAAPVVAVTPQLPAPKHKAKVVASESGAAPVSARARVQPTEAEQVAEDAAAAGMTSRAQPGPNATGPDTPR